MKALNDRQLEVLKWIGAGCPPRDWPDYTHRTTARALASRGLVTVRGHGPSWVATMASSGLAYLENGPPSKSKTTARSTKQSTPTRDPNSGTPITAESVLAALKDADGVLTVQNPPAHVRAAYRRALAGVTREDLPSGQRITFTGRDRGDMVVRLTSTPRRTDPPANVPVPPHVDEAHPVTRVLRQRPDALHVSDESRDRALRLLHAVAQEAQRRGYAYTVPEEGPSVMITIGEVTVSFRMHEEKDRVHQVDDQELDTLKYSWQRAPLHRAKAWSGRLALTLDDDNMWGKPTSWGDRKRWTLDSRLSRALQGAEEQAEQTRQRREAADLAKQERRRRWEDAVPQAKAAYVEELNRERLSDQVGALTHTANLRAYSDAIDTRAATLPDDQQASAREWAQWIRNEADRTDPLLQIEQLQYARPEELHAIQIDRYMPDGMVSSRPPD